MEELNLSPLGLLIFYIVFIGLLILALSLKSYETIDIESEEERQEREKREAQKKRDEIIASRRGAYMQIQHR